MDRRIKPSLPRHIAVALCALRFHDSRPEGLRTLEDQEWERVLSYTDSAHLTLHLATVCRDYFPQWVKERTARNLSDNGERFIRIKEAYQDLANAFRVTGVEHLVLKGFSHWPDYVENPRLRLQSDIDLFCPPQSIIKARATLESIGYRAVPTGPGIEIHIPIMIRQSGWQWKGQSLRSKAPTSRGNLTHQLWSSDRHRFWARPYRRLLASQHSAASRGSNLSGASLGRHPRICRPSSVARLVESRPLQS